VPVRQLMSRPWFAVRWWSLEDAGRGLLLLHLALSPLVFSTGTLEAFEFPKVLLLTATAILLGALGLCILLRTLALAQTGSRLVRACSDPVGLGVVLLLVSAAASTAASISPRTSWLGTLHSHTGLGTVTAYTVLFFATRALCRTWADARRFLAASVLAAAG